MGRFTRHTLLGFTIAITALTAAYAQDTAAPKLTAIRNAASYSDAIGQGSLATAFGERLIDQQRTAANNECYPSWEDRTEPVTFPSSLCGVTVVADGTPLPITYAGRQARYDQINFQVPFGVSTRNIKVIREGVESNPIAIDIRDKAPGVFWYHNHFAAAQKGDFSVIHPGNPVRIPSGDTIALDSWVVFYTQGLGTPIDAPVPALGSLYPAAGVAHLATPRILIDGEELPSQYIANASGAPGLIIQQINWHPPKGMTPGPKTVQVCAGDVCSAPVNVTMTTGNDFVYGTVRSPGRMSDGVERPLSAFNTKTGALETKVDAWGNYFIPASGKVDLHFLGGSTFYNWHKPVNVSGVTEGPSPMAFPRVAYNAPGDPVTENAVIDLYDYLDRMNVAPLAAACNGTIYRWQKTDAAGNVVIPVYLNRANANVITATGPIDGPSILFDEIRNQITPAAGGRVQFVESDHQLQPGERGINVVWEKPLGGGGYYSVTEGVPCVGPSQTGVMLAPKVGTIAVLQNTGRHEFLHGLGIGSSGQHSDFVADTMSPGGSLQYTPREKDSTRMLYSLDEGTNTRTEYYK